VLPGLNIAGFAMAVIGFGLVVKTDQFAVSLTLASLFKFLEEEAEEQGSNEEAELFLDEDKKIDDGSV
jgi:hypothetical protein